MWMRATVLVNGNPDNYNPLVIYVHVVATTVHYKSDIM